MPVLFNTVLRKGNDDYSAKQQAGKSTDKAMFKLAWDLKDLSDLDETGRKLKVNCETIKDKTQNESFDFVTSNMASQLCSLRGKLEIFVKGVYRYRRTAATHILVIMISPEERNRKPYALPVQCMPYVGLGDMEVRVITDKVIQEMTNRGMKVAGAFSLCKIKSFSCYVSKSISTN